MNSQSQQLDSFESALLVELRREVAEHPVQGPLPAPTPGRRPRLRLAAVAATGVAATVVAAVGLGGTGGSPAYAVEQDGAGDVIVTVHRLDDADGLERALEAKGIDADVSFDADGFATSLGIGPDGEPLSEDELPSPPPGQGPESGSESEGGGGGNVEMGQGPVGTSPEDACDLGADPSTLTRVGDGWVLRIPADSPLRDRHVYLGTDSEGALFVSYAGNVPGSACGMVTRTKG